MWTCERIKRTKYGFMVCHWEAKQFRTLHEAEAYAKERVNAVKDDRFLCDVFYMYQIKRPHRKTHFVARSGTWIE